MDANYPWNIKEYLGKNDGQCEQEVWGEWHPYRCQRKAKEKIDGANLCKQHTQKLRDWRLK